MSAFVVDEKTIDRIITGMISIKEFQEYVLDDLDLDLRDQDAKNLFGRELLNMNIDAVNARYPDEVIPHDDSYVFNLTVADNWFIQSIKSLRCLLYQCAEGDIDESPTYRLMQNIQGLMCFEYVQGLPEYDNAEWD